MIYFFSKFMNLISYTFDWFVVTLRLSVVQEEDFGSPVNSVAPERLENISEVDSFGQERSEDAEPAELHRGQRSPMGVYHKRVLHSHLL